MKYVRMQLRKNSVVNAIKNEEFHDFEDCLQELCASNANCDYVITSNIKDFRNSAVCAVTPDVFRSICLS